jgi:hypothetical protein
MKKLTHLSVIRQLPEVFLYFLMGSVAGFLFGYFLFNFNKSSYEFILTLWFKRLLFGVKFVGNQYIFWFIINNFTAMLLAIAAALLILTQIARRKDYLFAKRFKFTEKRHPKITLFSLYMIPIGALIINGFLISLFLTFVLLNNGFDQLTLILLKLSPHGVGELLGLFLATSLGLCYIKILSHLILSKKWNLSIKESKKLFFSNVTIFYIFLIAVLVVFSGYLEGTSLLR